MNQDRVTHPPPEQLTEFVRGQLDDVLQAEVESHILNCEQCVNYLRTVSEDDLQFRIKTADTSTFEPASLTRILPTADSSDAKSQPEGQTQFGELSEEVLTALVNHPRYKIGPQLGAGGMGVVYRAEHRLMERSVAIKVISPRLVSHAKTVERFRQEVKAAAKLSHRNIVAAYDADQVGALHFLVMEFVEGSSLDLVVKEKGRLPIKQASSFILQSALGLQHAHENGMVHRDIKPQNLMLTPQGQIKILDFGLARLAAESDDEKQTELTAVGVTVGTPDYMSPEQARNSRKVDSRSDIYSLGCTFYFLLTGQPLFPEGSALEKVVAHIEREPVSVTQLRKDIPAEIADVLQRMLEKEPGKRYQTPAEVAEDLKSFLKNSTVVTSTLNEPRAPLISINTEIKKTHASFQKRNNHSLTRIWGVAALALVCGALLLWWFTRGDLNNGNGTVQNEPSPPNKEEGLEPEWINLIPQVDLQQPVSGNWIRENEELRVAPQKWARLSLPYRPPPEYDFEVTFTRWDGQFSIAMIFVQGSGQATFEVDAWDTDLIGFQLIDGQQLNQQTQNVESRSLENGRRHKLLLKVRTDSVEGYLDEELVARYRGDGADLSIMDRWNLQNARSLGIGAYEANTTFHSIRVRPQ